MTLPSHCTSVTASAYAWFCVKTAKKKHLSHHLVIRIQSTMMQTTSRCSGRIVRQNKPENKLVRGYTSLQMAQAELSQRVPLFLLQRFPEGGKLFVTIVIMVCGPASTWWVFTGVWGGEILGLQERREAKAIWERYVLHKAPIANVLINQMVFNNKTYVVALNIKFTTPSRVVLPIYLASTMPFSM